MTTDTPYSTSSSPLESIRTHFSLYLTAVLIFGGGFLFGSLFTENQLLKKGMAPSALGAATDQPAEPDGPTPDQLAKVPPVSDTDHVRGNANAQITLIEYSDFECPFCARFHPTMLQVMKEYGDKVKWVYRHYPLPFHPNAQKAGEGAECVAKLAGKDAFWKYGDYLFEENNKLGGKLTAEAITEGAKVVGVNSDAFKKCLDSGEMAARVKADMDKGAETGVNGTPGTFIVTKDGAQELIPGALPYEEVKDLLDKYVQ